MNKNQLISDIIDLIISKVKLSKTGLYTCELSKMILIYNPYSTILFRLKGFTTLVINDENISELELIDIHMEIKHKYETTNKAMKHCGTCALKDRTSKIMENPVKWVCGITKERVCILTDSCKYHSGYKLYKEGYKLYEANKN